MADSTVQTIISQVAGAVTSAATPLTAGFTAVSDLAKDAAMIANPTLVQRINQLKEAAQTDVTKFKDYLLARDLAGVQSALAGLPVYIGIELSPTEYQQLDGIHAPSLTGNQLLGFYNAGRGAKLESDIVALVEASPKP